MNVSTAATSNYLAGAGTITVTVTKKTTTMAITTTFDDGKDLYTASEGLIKGIVKYNDEVLSPQPTITYSSSDETVATVDEAGIITFVKAGTTTLTASYAGTAEYEECEATYELTLVDTTPQETKIEITPNYTFFGKNAQFSGTTYDEVTGEKNSVSVTYTRNSGSTYANTAAMRFYKSNTLTIDAPTGYHIIEIAFTLSGSSSDITADNDTYDAEEAVWTGDATSVTFTRPSSASAYATISKIAVTIAETATIGSAGYTTYVAKHDISFPEGVTAFIATTTGNETVRLSPRESVPVGTAVVLKAVAATYALPAIDTTPESVTGNLLAASDGTVTGGDGIYALGYKNSTIGFYLVGSNVTIPSEPAMDESAIADAESPIRPREEITWSSAPNLIPRAVIRESIATV